MAIWPAFEMVSMKPEGSSGGLKLLVYAVYWVVNFEVSGRRGTVVLLVMVVILNFISLYGVVRDLGFSARFAVEVKNTPLSHGDSLAENG